MTQPSAAELLADSQEDQAAAPKASLDDLMKMGYELEDIEADMAHLEDKLKDLGKQASALRNGKIPQALMDLKLKDFTLQNGVKLILSEVIKGQITDENREAAHEWLRNNGHGDLIKNEVKVTFGKGEDDYATLLTGLINDLRKDDKIRCGSVEQKEAVHTQTLWAFLREQLAKGTAFPGETFKLDVFHVAKLKRPGEKA